MAAVVRYWNPGSTSGGNGTTPALTGANRAYVSLNAFDAAESTDLVSDGDTMEINGAGTVADSTATVIASADWTTGSSNGIEIIGDFDSDRWDTNFCRIDLANGYSDVLEIQVGYCNITGVQLRNSQNNQYTSVLTLAPVNASGVTNISRCIFRQVSGITTTTSALVLGGTAATRTISINDCLVYDVNRFTNFAYLSSITLNLVNITVDNATVNGIESGYTIGGLHLYNCLCTNAGTSDFAVNAGTLTASGNNVSTDATSPQVGGRSKTITYTDAGNDVYTVGSGETDVVGQGVGPSSQSLVSALSLDSNVRSGTTTDVGSFLFVAAGGSTPKGPFSHPFYGPFRGPIS